MAAVRTLDAKRGHSGRSRGVVGSKFGDFEQ